MSATAISIPLTRQRRGASRVIGAVRDTYAVAIRNLIQYKRVPQLLVFSTIQPVIFVLMFRYVFGGAIHVPGTSYVDLHLDDHATLMFTSDASKFPVVLTRYEGIECMNRSPMVYANVRLMLGLPDFSAMVPMTDLDELKLACAYPDRNGVPQN